MSELDETSPITAAMSESDRTTHSSNVESDSDRTPQSNAAMPYFEHITQPIYDHDIDTFDHHDFAHFGVSNREFIDDGSIDAALTTCRSNLIEPELAELRDDCVDWLSNAFLTESAPEWKKIPPKYKEDSVNEGERLYELVERLGPNCHDVDSLKDLEGGSLECLCRLMAPLIDYKRQKRPITVPGDLISLSKLILELPWNDTEWLRDELARERSRNAKLRGEIAELTSRLQSPSASGEGSVTIYTPSTGRSPTPSSWERIPAATDPTCTVTVGTEHSEPSHKRPKRERSLLGFCGAAFS